MKKIFLSLSIVLTVLIADSNYTLAQEKKKMSGQAKGAIIGGAGGAVVGGLIGHNVGGALIGGAIGAGGGYIIGNEHRRHVAKKNRAAQRAYYRRHHTVTHPSKNVTVIRKHD
ncbi:MAG: YMGG-like glycine zipper-containing protein [Bacteroidota bacterium]